MGQPREANSLTCEGYIKRLTSFEDTKSHSSSLIQREERGNLIQCKDKKESEFSMERKEDKFVFIGLTRASSFEDLGFLQETFLQGYCLGCWLAHHLGFGLVLVLEVFIGQIL